MAERKCRKQKNGGGAPAWMVTYSDMVTLLLTFFILLLSMAEMDKVKFQKAAGSLKGAFGAISETDTKPETVIPQLRAITDEMVQKSYNKAVIEFEKLAVDEDIEMVKERGAIVLRIKDKILFAGGSDTLKPEAGPVLRKVAELISPLPYEVRIEGHTDNIPFAGSSRTNWDLSVQRAISVLKFYGSNDLLPLDRLSAVGYGDQKPLVPNDTSENRAMNRRVEFVLQTGADYRQELPYLINSRETLPF